MSPPEHKSAIARRFRGFLPVVVDVETGGFNPARHALLEIAVCPIRMDDSGLVAPGSIVSAHVKPFPDGVVEPESLEVTGIDPDHPFRNAVEELEALRQICRPVRQEMRDTGCNRAILVGHNSAFDMAFLNAAIERTGYKRSPFHPFSTFDTVTLGGLAYGQTVLARAASAAKIEWQADYAHSATYDVQKTSELFCAIVNQWHEKIGIPWTWPNNS